MSEERLVVISYKTTRLLKTLRKYQFSIWISILMMAVKVIPFVMLTEFESQVLLWMQVPSSPSTPSARPSWMRIFHFDRLYVGTILTVKKFMAYLESYVLCVFLFFTIGGNVSMEWKFCLKSNAIDIGKNGFNSLCT